MPTAPLDKRSCSSAEQFTSPDAIALGEAAARTPEESKSLYPDIPWRQISDLRNRLIHGYDVIDIDIVWSVLNVDLPALVARLDSILKEAGSNDPASSSSES
jgi:uncharacterized protein with HEPN domain